MQLGFVIDQTRCIGCHACTVACKAENQVPVGAFRTWVKYTERGEFPAVRRSFAVLRCNQCTDAPCVTICPVAALEKRKDGIVDVDPEACIGCKSCMQACPYDALYLNEDSGTAQKCHFCAHRVERGLAPACAVVCPTEAIIPGDFHNPLSLVSRMVAGGNLSVRKPEAETGPNVHYLGADSAGLDPLATRASGGYLWANRAAEAALGDEGQPLGAGAEPLARTTYDVDHKPMWGWRITAYLYFKSLAAGIPLWIASFWLWGVAGMSEPGLTAIVVAASAIAFLAATCLLLVADLKRPERFLYILLRPQMRSWLTRGSFIIGLQGLFLGIWLILLLSGAAPTGLGAIGVLVPGALLSILTAAYTAWLFGQARGRVLWMRRFLDVHLVVQAVAGGAAFLAMLLPFMPQAEAGVAVLNSGLAWALLAHLALTVAEPGLSPRGREPEYAQASWLISHGRFARRHWLRGVGVGIAAPLMLLLAAGLTASPWLVAAAGLLALYGLLVEEDVLVQAGQALSIS